MGFIDSYKHLEKLCGEVLNDDRRISAYIDEMLNTPRGSRLVAGWDEDLRILKHYRWVRNRIVHDPECTEENMCEPEDALWLDNFYSRIMNRTDPLALYIRATKPRPVQREKQVYTSQSSNDSYSKPTINPKRNAYKPVGCLTFLIGSLLLATVIVLVLQII